MAEASSLLDEEDEVDENILLLNFYQGNLQFLNQVPLHRVPNDLKFDVAAVFYETSLDKKEWIGVLEKLGVDHKTIYAIDCKTHNTGDLPLYIALRGILQNKTNFGGFIKVLCEKGHFRILHDLQPFVKDLLSERDSVIKEKTYSGPLPSAPEYSIVESTSSIIDSGRFEVNFTHGTGYDSVNYQEKHIKTDQKTVLDQFQGCEISSPFVKSKQSSNGLNSQIVNGSTHELISVFIMHSMLDKKYAKRLATHLKEKNFQVITSADIYPYLRENHTRIMKMVDERVDFVIPVVSESFMNQIKVTLCSTAEEKDIECIANTFMYDRLMNEYSNQNNCFNIRVKPVIYSLESRKLARDQILSVSTFLSYNDLQDYEVLKMKLFQHLRRSKKHLGHFK